MPLTQKLNWVAGGAGRGSTVNKRSVRSKRNCVRLLLTIKLDCRLCSIVKLRQTRGGPDDTALEGACHDAVGGCAVANTSSPSGSTAIGKT